MRELSSTHHVHETKGEMEYHSLADKIFENTGVSDERCYQCGKCSAGCPVADEMDLPPSMVMRLLQTENPANDEKVLKSH